MSSRSSARPFAAPFFAGTISLLAALIAADLILAADEPHRFWAFVGTYTGDDSQGIYSFQFDARTGKAGDVQLAAEVTNPSFLAIRPDGEYLYAVNEVASSDGKSGGAVAAFRIDRDSGRLELLNQASTVGAGPCHLVVDR